MISFGLSGCDYWEKEKPNAVMPVKVLAIQRVLLANPVVLTVTPLTIGSAQHLGIVGDFSDNKVSPNRARMYNYI